jgi:hypothetical protein
MGKRYILAAALAALLIPGFAAAEEILHFENGTSMAVRSHEIKDGMIHVDLGSNGFMAFPEHLVESIDVAGKNVKLKASTNGGKAPKAPTVIASGPLGGGTVVRQPEREFPKGINDEGMAGVEVDDKGVATVRPFAGSNNPRKRDVRVSGSSAVYSAPPQTRRNGNGLLGATRVGSKFQIGSSQRRGGARKPVVTGLTRNQGSRPQQPQNPSDGSGDATDGGSGNDSSGSGSDDN